jgi:hypothetical protein
VAAADNSLLTGWRWIEVYAPHPEGPDGGFVRTIRKNPLLETT